jgi:hypothetical protein
MTDTPDTPETSNTSEETDATSSEQVVEDQTPEHVSQDCAKAPLNPKWSIKLFIITFFVIGFGALGLYDAVIKYPERGQRYADWAKWQYLEAAKTAGTEQFGIFRESSVSDPVAELERLSDPQQRESDGRDAVNQSSPSYLRATMRNTRYEWLKALNTIGQLSEENTTFDSPDEELARSKAVWTSGTNPKPLKSYDIPSQWGIMIICWGVGGWMLLHIFKVIGQKFSWDAESMTLTIPGSISVNPSQLEEVDKRKWDKFIVFLKLNDSHPTHAGKELKVDTYQHALVEDWVLAMEAASPQASGSDSQESGE